MNRACEPCSRDDCDNCRIIGCVCCGDASAVDDDVIYVDMEPASYRKPTEAEDVAVLNLTDEWHACTHNDHPLQWHLGFDWTQYDHWVQTNQVPVDWTTRALIACEHC